MKKYLFFFAFVLAAFFLSALFTRTDAKDQLPIVAAQEDGTVDGVEGATILDVQFPLDFDTKFSPNNSETLAATSQFAWAQVDINQATEIGVSNIVTLPLDDAVFSRGVSTVIGDHTVMLSLPFRHWVPQSAGINASLYSACNAAVVTKQPIALDAHEILHANLQFNCKTFHTEKHNFVNGAVTDAFDDLRLASCTFHVTDKTGISFGILLTNEVVWAAYSRQHPHHTGSNNNTHRAFTIYRRLAIRNKTSDLVDARITIDRIRNETRFAINHDVLWTIGGGDWGAPSLEFISDEQNRLVSIAEGELAQAVPSSLSIVIANAHRMDVADPNNVELLGDDNKALVKYTYQRGYYGRAMKFWDRQSLHDSSLYGQGAKMGLKRLLVVKITADDIARQHQTFEAKQKAKEIANQLTARAASEWVPLKVL